MSAAIGRTESKDCISSSNPSQVVAALPVGRQGAEDALKGGVFGGIFGEGESFAAGLLEELAVAQRICNMETKVAGLTRAEEFAGAADFEIGFSDFEAVGGAHHSVETGARFVGHADGADEDAVGFGGAAADATAQLMELREAEALG